MNRVQQGMALVEAIAAFLAVLFVLLVFAWVIVGPQWICAAVVLVVVCCAWFAGYRERLAKEAAERDRITALIARADEQHAWTMTGDERGIYGAFPPAPAPSGFIPRPRPKSTRKI